MPISTPVKLALSTEKLFNKTIQVLKAIGIAIDDSINNVIGFLLFNKFFIAI